jgi:hypothetical protein
LRTRTGGKVTEPHQIFVSYSSQDKPTADAVVEALENAYFKCWIAPRDIKPGGKHAEAILDALDECKVFLVVLTESANDSPQVEMEVDRAASKNKIIVSYKLYEGKLSKSFEYYLGNRHWLEGMNPPRERDNQALISALKEFVRPNEPEPEPGPVVEEEEVAPPATPAPEEEPSEAPLSRPHLNPLTAASLVLGLTVVVGLVAWSSGALGMHVPQATATFIAVRPSTLPSETVVPKETAVSTETIAPSKTPPPTQASPTATPPLWDQAIPVTYGQKMTSLPRAGVVITYGFYGAKGDIVSVVVESSNASPNNKVCSRPSHNWIPAPTYMTSFTLDPDGGGETVESLREMKSRDAIRDYELPASGAYHIQLHCEGSVCNAPCTSAVLTLEKK